MDDAARWQAIREAMLGVEAALEAWLRSQPVEARFAAHPLRSERLHRLADWRRQCRDEA
jgi:hypothetical protein